MIAALSARGIRFACVGAALTLLSYAVYAAALYVGAHYLAAATLGWAVSVVISYFANKSFTFARGTAFVWSEFLMLIVGCVLQLGLGLAGLYVLVGRLGIGEMPAFWLNLVLTASFSFLFMQLAVFRRR